MIVLALLVAALSFLISAWAGLGGSLLLVPMLSLLLGPKQGVAAAALLLGINNISKTIAYRKTVPLRASFWVLIFNTLGTILGAGLLVVAPDDWVSMVIIVVFGVTFLTEHFQVTRLKQIAAPLLAFFAGATSGFSGTSGPLKGIALRALQLDRLHFVGAASVVSMVGDLTKATVFAEASLLDGTAWPFVVVSVPLMGLATLLGRRFNRSLGEHVHKIAFWTVMGGYSLRLLLS